MAGTLMGWRCQPGACGEQRHHRARGSSTPARTPAQLLLFHTHQLQTQCIIYLTPLFQNRMCTTGWYETTKKTAMNKSCFHCPAEPPSAAHLLPVRSLQHGCGWDSPFCHHKCWGVWLCPIAGSREGGNALTVLLFALIPLNCAPLGHPPT